jgi:glycosyltransferase involved in cell wall biosynthesis
VSDRSEKRVSILGTRGVPARHGGYETFAAHLAPYLVAHGWDVTVYCQREDGVNAWASDDWNGVHRVHVPIRSGGAVGTGEFDVRATLHALRRDDLKLVLGYNTAVLNVVLRAGGRRIVMNMDGIEWRRAKWSPPLRAWLRANEWIGAATSHHLIADHPEIERHLRGVRASATITVIPYGADVVADPRPPGLDALGLGDDPYFVVVARLEPENSILEIVRAFSRAPLDAKLVVLGQLTPDEVPYHAAVRAAAGPGCVFPGAIYDAPVVAALRHHAVAYVHGHTVGGTNPSLVEALGAGAAVIAHDNVFNRWVAEDAAEYFRDEDGCRAAMLRLLSSDGQRAARRAASTARHRAAFTWETILGAYDAMLHDEWSRRRP